MSEVHEGWIHSTPYLPNTLTVRKCIFFAYEKMFNNFTSWENRRLPRCHKLGKFRQPAGIRNFSSGCSRLYYKNMHALNFQINKQTTTFAHRKYSSGISSICSATEKKRFFRTNNWGSCLVFGKACINSGFEKIFIPVLVQPRTFLFRQITDQVSETRDTEHTCHA